MASVRPIPYLQPVPGAIKSADRQRPVNNGYVGLRALSLVEQRFTPSADRRMLLDAGFDGIRFPSKFRSGVVDLKRWKLHAPMEARRSQVF